MVCTAVCLLLGGGVVADCEFKIPSTEQKDACDRYSLPSGPFNISDMKFNYTFGFCQSVSLPKQCSSAQPGMAAYQYNSESCYALGSAKEESTYLVSLIINMSSGVLTGS